MVIEPPLRKSGFFHQFYETDGVYPFLAEQPLCCTQDAFSVMDCLLFANAHCMVPPLTTSSKNTVRHGKHNYDQNRFLVATPWNHNYGRNCDLACQRLDQTARVRIREQKSNQSGSP